MRLVLKFRSHNTIQTECPPESYWDLEQRRLLSRSERADIQQHCVRCEACRLREERTATHDGIPARVVAGLAASVLLAGVIRMPVTRYVTAEDFVPAVSPVVSLAHQTLLPVAQEPEVVAEEDQATVEDATPVVPRVRRATPKRVEEKPVLVARTFVPPPQRKSRRMEPVKLDPPPMGLMAKLDSPKLPETFPTLQPPRRGPLKKIVSALAVPFRHI